MAISEAGEVVKLLGAPLSPFVVRTRIALNLKGVPYEFLLQDLGNKGELLLKSNPIYKKIPVLIHKGKPICESLIIVQYIDDYWTKTGPSILPSTPYDRATARFWGVYIDDKLFPAFRLIIRAKTDEALAESVEQFSTAIQHLEEAFPKIAKGKPFFGGDTIGYLDIALGSCFGWYKAAEILMDVTLLDPAKLPNVVGWLDQFCADDAVKDVLPSTERYVELGKKLQASWNAPPATK